MTSTSHRQTVLHIGQVLGLFILVLSGTLAVHFVLSTPVFSAKRAHLYLHQWDHQSNIPLQGAWGVVAGEHLHPLLFYPDSLEHVRDFVTPSGHWQVPHRPKVRIQDPEHTTLILSMKLRNNATYTIEFPPLSTPYSVWVDKVRHLHEPSVYDASLPAPPPKTQSLTLTGKNEFVSLIVHLRTQDTHQGYWPTPVLRYHTSSSIWFYLIWVAMAIGWGMALWLRARAYPHTSAWFALASLCTGAAITALASSYTLFVWYGALTLAMTLMAKRRGVALISLIFISALSGLSVMLWPMHTAYLTGGLLILLWAMTLDHPLSTVWLHWLVSGTTLALIVTLWLIAPLIINLRPVADLPWLPLVTILGVLITLKTLPEHRVDTL